LLLALKAPPKGVTKRRGKISEYTFPFLTTRSNETGTPPLASFAWKQGPFVFFFFRFPEGKYTLRSSFRRIEAKGQKDWLSRGNKQ